MAGPYWYEGPDFQKRHEIRPPKTFDPKEYSDNFLTFVGDFNGDGWPDVLYVGFPGGDAYWYENPAGKEGHWKRHLAAKNVGNESPAWADINGDGRPELIYNIDGYLGYATYDPAKPDEPWVFPRHHAQGKVPAVHARPRRGRHRRSRPDGHRRGHRLVGTAGRCQARPDVDQAPLPLCRRGPRRCSFTTWTATGWPT